jgi:zinc D-Ala-D-Ala carboxypeptidase
VDAIPHNLVRFESQLERAISRERGRRWHRSAGRGRSITWLAFTLLALVVGVGLVLFWHDRAGATGTLEREAPPVRQATRRTPRQPGQIFAKSQHSTTAPASIWVVVNKQHPLDPESYVPRDLTPVGNGQYMRAEAAAALNRMLSGARQVGHAVAPDSGYRAYRYQVTVYDSEVDADGRTKADTVSARPGYSEHQTGWAVDLGSGGCNITDCFGATPGGRWVTANAFRYGFILRYPASKTGITGYSGEPWHFRYVGTKLARELHKEHVATLEEFFNISGGASDRVPG